MNEMNIRESQIEDVLVGAPLLTKNILNLDDEPRLLVRQMIVPSGRLDLLYAYQTNLLLIELKVVPFQQKFVQQVLAYKRDLIGYQEQGKLLQGKILPYLLCPSIVEEQRRAVAELGIVGVDYKPEEVLQFFYQNFKPIAAFTKIKPVDIGIWNLHLVHDFIYLLKDTVRVSDLHQIVRGSPKTLYNKIKFASELRLVNWKPNGDSISLSDFGTEYVERRDSVLPQRLSEAQVELLRRFVIQNPYESSVVLGIASVVEAVFALSKNTYPVPMPHLTQYFSYYAGKYFDWQTEKAKYNATRMYSNYAVDLGLLAKSGETIYMTPEGFRFTIQMQLHKSLKMMDSLKIA
jgi:hypothetical protein